MGFEAGVFQASPVVVAVAGVQGQVGRDVDAYACHCAEAQAADAAAFVISRFSDRSSWDRTWRTAFWVSGNNLSFLLNRTNLMSDVSVGDAHADIGFEFVVEFEIVNGGQAERGNGVERTVFLIFRLSGLYVKIAAARRGTILSSQLFYADGIFIVVPFSVTGIICRYPPAAEVVADRHPGVDGMRTDVSEIIAYRAYFFVFFCTGWFRIIVGNAFGGVG